MRRTISGIYGSPFELREMYAPKPPDETKKLRIREGSSPKLSGYANKMRRNPTSLERILAAALSMGTRYHIKKQVVVLNYILDAYIPKLKLAFEADGPLHREPGGREKDAARDMVLYRAGIKTIHFSERELRQNFKGVVEKIALMVSIREDEINPVILATTTKQH